MRKRRSCEVLWAGGIWTTNGGRPNRQAGPGVNAQTLAFVAAEHVRFDPRRRFGAARAQVGQESLELRQRRERVGALCLVDGGEVGESHPVAAAQALVAQARRAAALQGLEHGAHQGGVVFGVLGVGGVADDRRGHCGGRGGGRHAGLLSWWAFLPLKTAARRQRMRAAEICRKAHPLRLAKRLHRMTTLPPTTAVNTAAAATPDDFATLLAALRPRLHRYCARMAGSALDGEDIVQDALAKAALHYDAGVVRQAEAWLFRIAHNAAMDFLRRRTLERSLFVETDAEELAEPDAAQDPQAAAETAAAALVTFMHLPITQRSAVILADVLGYALTEIAQLLETTVPAVKAALHRGRVRLRELGPQLAQPALPPEQYALERLYAERFNARDFDGLRALLAEEVRLQLAGRLEMKGKAEVSNYFGNYARIEGWRVEAGVIEGYAGVWVFEGSAAHAAYGIVLDGGDNGTLNRVRDFRYARHVTFRPVN